MRQMYAVERRWRKPPPAPYHNNWDAIWVNFASEADAVLCMADENETCEVYEYRVVPQTQMYGVAA